jgi:chromosome segregation ATPase
MQNFNDSINILDANIKKIDDNIIDLNDKSMEIKKKIDMLNNKVHLKLHDSTQLLHFQHLIILNEINYLKHLKQILLSNFNAQLYELAENIYFLTLSIIHIYKDIPNTQCKNAIISNKNDELEKIINDISANLAYINEILENFKAYINSLNSELEKGNFHCKTLKKDMENIYNHINTEYSKYVDNTTQSIAYYVEFSNIISTQIDSMKIASFYN